MKVFLGLDGGQSSTTALIGDEDGRIVGVGHAGPCNHAGSQGGHARFVSAVGESVRSALEHAGLNDTTFEASCFGFSGGPSDKEVITRGLIKALNYFITHDAWIALAGATAGEPGVIAIAGTGSIAFGRNVDNRSSRAGGWGYTFGDEGGAFDIVRQGLRAVLRHEEGWGPPTLLRGLLLSASGASDANDLLHRFYTDEFPRTRVAAFSPLIDQAAASGDLIAQDILKTAAQAIATFVTAVRGQLFLPSEVVPVSYAGGVFRSAVLKERFRVLVELQENNRLVAPRYGPAAGALLEAYRVAGLACTLKNVGD